MLLFFVRVVRQHFGQPSEITHEQLTHGGEAYGGRRMDRAEVSHAAASAHRHTAMLMEYGDVVIEDRASRCRTTWGAAGKCGIEGGPHGC